MSERLILWFWHILHFAASGYLRAAITNSGFMKTRPSMILWQIYSRRCSLQIHFRQCGHRCGGSRSDEFEDGVVHCAAKSAGERPVHFLFPALPLCSKAAILEEGLRDHGHKRMTAKALPGSSLEVIETEFFFQLLVSLLAQSTAPLWWPPRCAGPSLPAGWRNIFLFPHILFRR